MTLVSAPDPRELKESGLVWLGRIPRHWRVARAKTFLRCIDNRSVAGQEDLLTVSSDRGVIPRASAAVTMFKAASYIGHKLCWPGDLVINSLWAWSRGLGVSGYHGIVSTAYGVYRPRNPPDVVPAFVHALVRSTPFNWELRVRSKGIWISRLQMTDEAFLGAPFPIPPLPEQRAIARFLGHADRRIRRYIRAKERLIELLEEQKQAIIHQAVTGQIDFRTGQPYPAYKDSGVEWLGEVPEHWGVRRVKGATRILRGKFTHRPRNDPSLYGGPFPFVQTGDVARASKKIESYSQTLNEKGLAVSRKFPSGTLVMAIAANIGDVAVLDFEACFPDSVVGFVPIKEITRRDYLYYVFLAMKRELIREAPVNTQGNLNVERLGSRRIPLPPYSEQFLIDRYIGEATVNLNSVVDQIRRQIELLKEYRTRLVADVVTGKLDVREAAASLPHTDPLSSSDARDNPAATTTMASGQPDAALCTSHP